MIKILVSSCLFGCKVRYHGGDAKLSHILFDQWIAEGRVLHFCPEISAGLSVPRISSEIIGGDGKNVYAGEAKVVSKLGEDKTEAFLKGAHLMLAFALHHHITVAVLKKDSPSCGNTTIYDGTYSGKIKKGSGVSASLLISHGIQVFNETQLEEVQHYIITHE